ncbi:hypothetical protein GCM10027422_27430 [Hymenobacter arcticus]
MKLYPLLLSPMLLLSACTQKDPVDERHRYPPFEVRATGTSSRTLLPGLIWSTSLWSARHDALDYTLYYDGKLLPLPGVPGQAAQAAEGPKPAGAAQPAGRPRFHWLQALPEGGLLLGRLAPDSVNATCYELYLLRATATGSRTYVLGRCDLTDPLRREYDQPALTLTPDGRGLLLPSLTNVEGGPRSSRFIDLATPAHYFSLPQIDGATPTGLPELDGAMLRLQSLRWSPDREWVARAYQAAGGGPGVADCKSLLTSQYRRFNLPTGTDTARTDTTGTAAPFDQLYWRARPGGGYELAQRPQPPARHPAPAAHRTGRGPRRPAHRGRPQR